VPRLLLIAADPAARPLTPALSVAAGFQLQVRARLAEAHAALAAGAFDAVVLAPARADMEALHETTVARAAAPRLPLVVLLPTETDTATRQKFSAAGADLVPPPPLDVAALAATLQRLTGAAPTLPPARPEFSGSGTPFPSSGSTGQLFPPTPGPAFASALEVLRDFSPVLGVSLDWRELTRQFVLKLREVIGVARIAVFVEPPAGPEAEPDTGRLVCAAAAGLPRDLLGCVELTRRGGIGQRVTRRGQVLRAAEPDATADAAQIRREFELLGCEVALPVNDRERALGVALLGGRVTGGAFTDTELRLVYHLLEELGLALKNGWLHDQLAASHRLLGDVLGAITSGSLVVGADLTVRHANRAFVQFLRGDAPQAERRVGFSELPPPLASALHDLVEHGQNREPFFLGSETHPTRRHRVSLVAFPHPDGRLPQPALAIVEDYTRIEAAQRAEVEASNARLLALIAKRFAHEIRNSLVPLTTHHQLLDTEGGTAEFRVSLKEALGRETGRIQRFTEQMLFLSQPAAPTGDLVPVATVLEESLARAARTLGTEARLVLEGDRAAVVRAHRTGLAHAFEEIFLNALQSAPGAPVRVRLDTERLAPGGTRLVLRFRDAGPGLAPEVAARATEPFFTTRNTGVGLGLAVARRIVEQHAGRFEVRARATPDDPDIVLELPLA
jgi:signal transduction histidine kinase/CheY-like chemotaxis protein